MTMAVRIPHKLEDRLNNLAKKTGRTKSYYIRKALEQFIEDTEDYLLAVATLEKKNPRVSLKEVKRKLGLED